MNADLPTQIHTPNSSPFAASEGAGSGDALHLQVDQSGSINLGDEPWFLKADFGRDGLDLQVTGEDGQMVVIEGYFSADNPPDLVSGSGAVLNGAAATRLAGPLAPGQYAQAAQGPGANPIGRVETTSGPVQATRADGTEVTLSQGDPVFLGDILETGSDAAVGITFADESTFSLGEEGRMTLDDMVYDPGDQSGSMQVNLLQGAFTFVSGQIAKTDPNAMVITTPTSTIGIRGTAGGGTVDALGVTTAALMPEADGFTGEMTIGNDAGFQTINQPFQAVSIVSFDAPPSLPFIMSPQQLGQTFGGALSALPNAEQALPGTVIDGANEGRSNQQQAAQAAEEAEAAQAEAEALVEAAEQQAIEAQAEAEAAQQAEAQAAADAEAADLAAAEALVAAEAAAREAEAPTATPEQIAAAEEAAQAAEEAQGIAEQAAIEAEQAQTVVAQTQALAAQADANSASANADLAQATVAVIEAQVSVIETSSTGAVASAAVAAGIDDVPGIDDLNAAQEAVVEAQVQLQQAQAVAQEAQTAAEEAQATTAEIKAETQTESGDINSDNENNTQSPVNNDSNSNVVTQTQTGTLPIQQVEAPITLTITPLNNGQEPENTNSVISTPITENLVATSGDNPGLFSTIGSNTFAMTQGSNLGGTDKINGGSGDDVVNTLALQGLNNFLGTYTAVTDPADPTTSIKDLSYSFSDARGSGSGSIEIIGIDFITINDGGGGFDKLDLSQGETGTGVIRVGGSADDSLSASASLGTILFGKSGNDTLTGSSKEDHIFGGSGNDTLTGGAGNDTLNGGAGDDLIYSEGADDIDGGIGTDTIMMSSLSDSITVSNVETITGGAGTDMVILTDMTNTLSVSDVEFLDGGTGFDTITITGSTAASVFAGNGDDFVTGGAGDDILDGNSGADTLYGGAGVDVLSGGNGRDTLGGDGGSDIFRYTGVSESQVGSLRDVITDFDAIDSTEDILLDGLLTGTFAFLGNEMQSFTGTSNTEARFNDTSKILEIDVDGNGASDMEIELQGVALTNLGLDDFTVT